MEIDTKEISNFIKNVDKLNIKVEHQQMVIIFILSFLIFIVFVISIVIIVKELNNYYIKETKYNYVSETHGFKN